MVLVVLEASASAAVLVVVVMGSVAAKVIVLRAVVECTYWCESRWWRRKWRTYLVTMRRRSSNSLAAQGVGRRDVQMNDSVNSCSARANTATTDIGRQAD